MFIGFILGKIIVYCFPKQERYSCGYDVAFYSIHMSKTRDFWKGVSKKCIQKRTQIYGEKINSLKSTNSIIAN